MTTTPDTPSAPVTGKVIAYDYTTTVTRSVLTGQVSETVVIRRIVHVESTTYVPGTGALKGLPFRVTRLTEDLLTMNDMIYRVTASGPARRVDAPDGITRIESGRLWDDGVVAAERTYVLPRERVPFERDLPADLRALLLGPDAL